jgi:uncharacterized protein YwqG
MFDNIVRETVEQLRVETLKPYTKLMIMSKIKNRPKPDQSILAGIPPYIISIPQWNHNGQQENMIFIAHIDCAKIKLPGYPNKGFLQFWVNSFDEWPCEVKVIYYPNLDMKYFNVDALSTYAIWIDGLSKNDYLNKTPFRENASNSTPFFGYELGFETGNRMSLPTYSADEIYDYSKLFILKYNELAKNSYHIQEMKMTPHNLGMVTDIIEALEKEINVNLIVKNPIMNKIGGYPNFIQADPRRNPKNYDKTEVLLELESDMKTIMIGDCGNCQFLISKKDLKSLNFNNVLFDWACY